MFAYRIHERILEIVFLQQRLVFIADVYGVALAIHVLCFSSNFLTRQSREFSFRQRSKLLMECETTVCSYRRIRKRYYDLETKNLPHTKIRRHHHIMHMCCDTDTYAITTSRFWVTMLSQLFRLLNIYILLYTTCYLLLCTGLFSTYVIRPLYVLRLVIP